jgi:hypothetical protein
MDPVTANLHRLDDARLIAQPFHPALPDGVLIEISFGQFNEQVIVTGLTFHEAAIELSKVRIVETFTKSFEPFATSGFDEGEGEQLVEKTLGFASAFAFKFPELVDVQIFPLGSEPERPALELGQHEPEVTPLLRYDRRKRINEVLAGGVAGNQRDTAGSGFLFTPGVIGEDVFKRDGGEIDPARVGRQLQTEDIFLAGGFHGVKLMDLCTFAGNSHDWMTFWKSS